MGGGNYRHNGGNDYGGNDNYGGNDYGNNEFRSYDSSFPQPGMSGPPMSGPPMSGPPHSMPGDGYNYNNPQGQGQHWAPHSTSQQDDAEEGEIEIDYTRR